MFMMMVTTAAMATFLCLRVVFVVAPAVVVLMRVGGVRPGGERVLELTPRLLAGRHFGIGEQT